MNEIRFKPFKQQQILLNSDKRIKGAFAGRRAGKTEYGAIQSIIYQETKPNNTHSKIDPYLGVIIAPTYDMLRRLSLKKFMAYAKPFIRSFNKSTNEIIWHDGSIIYGLSAEKPERIEGLKINWSWADECIQMSEQLFLELKARTSDTKGYILCTGSLGVQYTNPKLTWVHKYFKEKPDENTICMEWATSQNNYFPQDELESLKNNLDPRTYRQMFTIDWDVTPANAVYDQFDEGNITRGYTYNPNFKTYVAIDWGYAHPMACLWFQYDDKNDIVYLFDEIVMSGLTLDKLWGMIKTRPYKIDAYCCDIAGNQEREQSAISNIRWFKEKYNVTFKFGRYNILPGVAFVRSYIKNGLGQSKFVIDEVRCPKTIDSIKMYKYPTKNGMISNENPEKLADDPVDALRYFFENFIRVKKPMKIEIG